MVSSGKIQAIKNFVPRRALATAQIIALAAVYVIFDRLGQYLAIAPGNVAAIWASSGIALAAILLLGNRVWPAILLGSFIANLWTLAGIATHPVATAILVAAAIGIGATGQAVLGAWLLQRTTGSRYPFDHLVDTVIFILLAAVIACSISPLIGLTSLSLAGYTPWSMYGSTWYAWWMSDVTGLLIITPLVLTWAMPYRLNLNFSRIAEAFVLLCLGTIVLLIVFDGGFFFGISNVAFDYLLIPLLAWAALRFGRRGTTLATLLISGTVLLGTLYGFGPFASTNHPLTLIELQGYLATIAITGLILSVAAAEQRRSHETLLQLAETLEERVCDRTASLDSLNQQLQHELAERKRIEDQLREGEEKFRSLVENTTDWVWEVDEHGAYTYVSPKVYDLLGYTPEEVLGKTPFDLMPPDEAVRVRGFFRSIAEKHEAFSSLENTNRHKDGHLVAVETNGRPIFDSVGNFRGYRGIDRDITERKKAEEALRRRGYQLATLARASQQINTVLEVPVVIRNLVSLAMELVSGTAGTAGLMRQGRVVFTEYNKLGTLMPIDIEFGPEEGVPGLTMVTKAPYISNDAEHDPHIVQEVWREFGFYNLIDIPVLNRFGELLGCFEIHNKIEKAPFTEDDIIVLQGLAASAAVALENAYLLEESKRAEEEIGRQRAFLRQVIDTTPSLIFVKDWEGRYVLANQMGADYYGVTIDELIGKTDADLNPELAAFYRPDDIEVMTTMQPKTIPEEPGYNAKDGKKVWLSTYKVPLISPEGTRQVLGVAVDITERKKAEEALQREEALLSTAIDLLPFPILFLSPTMEVFRRNKALRQLWAGEHLESIAKSDIHLLDPNTRTPIPLAQWPENRAAHGEVISAYEARLQLPNRYEFPILGHAAPIYVNGNLIAVIVAFQDITALKEADRAKDQFLMILSHELKTPLTSILGWTQAARTNAEITPQALEVVERNAREQQRILEDLLDVSRIVTGKLVVKPGPVDLWQLAVACADSSMHAAADRQIALVLDPPDTPLPIYADPGRITEVIGNLLINALKFTEPGGVVTLSGRREGDMAVLSVKDTGRGINPEQIPTLFRPFHQLQREEITGGLGLGLALVKGIVEIHGGQVSAASPGLGQGSTFTIKLPLRKDR